MKQRKMQAIAVVIIALSLLISAGCGGKSKSSSRSGTTLTGTGGGGGGGGGGGSTGGIRRAVAGNLATGHAIFSGELVSGEIFKGGDPDTGSAGGFVKIDLSGISTSSRVKTVKLHYTVTSGASLATFMLGFSFSDPQNNVNPVTATTNIEKIYGLNYAQNEFQIDYYQSALQGLNDAIANGQGYITYTFNFC